MVGPAKASRKDRRAVRRHPGCRVQRPDWQARSDTGGHSQRERSPLLADFCIHRKPSTIYAGGRSDEKLPVTVAASSLCSKYDSSHHSAIKVESRRAQLRKPFHGHVNVTRVIDLKVERSPGSHTAPAREWKPDLDTAGLELPPVAPLLMQSLRAVGYTLQTALADLIDNSIAAGARAIAIDFDAVPAGYIVIVDDGGGMDETTLVSAMRFGSRDPREVRSGMDLGRFGLGLKTASLSQCRRFTVASLQAGALSVARWDLDECERRGKWWLERPSTSELPREVVAALEAKGRGTAVLWERLDRLPAVGSDVARAFDRIMADAADHLALTFHRFLAGEIVGSFDILLNGRRLPHLDPFLAGHARGQTLHAETFDVEGHAVSVSPFVLPFPSRLKPGEIDRAGGRDTLKTGHGFYIYRGGRLVVPGGWFRIVPADELVRLARVRVDVPVALDHIWKVDIRKASADPPPALRPHLRRIVGDVTARSRRVYTYKGAPQRDADRVPLWQRHDGRDGAASWVVNREHPAVAATLLARGSDVDLERLLHLLEESIPAHEIHLHISNDLPVAELEVPPFEELRTLAERMVSAFADQPAMVRSLLAHLPTTDPFNRDPDAARRIAKDLAA